MSGNFEEPLANVDPKTIPFVAPWLGGKLYFSKRQQMKAERRMFGQLLDNCGVKEYTEMISWEMLEENPFEQPLAEDAVYVGMGYFHSWG